MDINEFEQKRKKQKDDAIFMHPDCQKMFNAAISELRLPETPETYLLTSAFKGILPDFSFNQLNFTLQEFEEVVSKSVHELHTGIVLFMIKAIKNAPLKSMNVLPLFWVEALQAADKVHKLIFELSEPIKADVIKSFWDGANIRQQNDIERTIEQMKKQEKNHIGNALTSIIK